MNKLQPVKLLLLFLSILLTSCATTEVTQPVEDNIYTINAAFNIVARGQFSNISLERQLIIKNKEDWQRLWNIHRGDRKNQSPKINFNDKIVIAIFSGQQPSGGYAVGVSQMKILDDNLYVGVTFKEPQQGDQVSLALTQPYIFVSTNKVDGKVIFIADTTSQ